MRDIATPAAATALAGLIWDQRKTAWHAAWCLAELVSDEEVEAALAGVVPVAHVPAMPWVWEPFRAEGTATAQVMGRVAWLVDRTRDADLPTSHVRVDHRLSLPLIAVALHEAPSEAVVEAQDRYRAGTPLTFSYVMDVAQAAFGTLDEPQAKLRLWNALPSDLAIGVACGALFSGRSFRPKDWVNVMARKSFFETFMIDIAFLGLLGSLVSFIASLLLYLGEVVSETWSTVLGLGSLGTFCAAFLLVLCADFLWRGNPMRDALGHAIRRSAATSSVVVR